jgi:glycosyltransferase involved in cell wall biosynthesis
MRRINGAEIAWSYFDYKNDLIAQWEIEFLDEQRSDHIIYDMDGLMEHSDISVWQMVHSLKALALFQAYRKKYPNKKLIMELDDDVFNVNPESIASQAYKPNSDYEYITEYQIKNASAMIVSTEYLKKSLKEKFFYWNKDWKRDSQNKEYTTNLRKIYKSYIHEKRIEVMPNCIDFELWDKLNNNNGHKKIRIGWSGGGAHKLDLAIINNIIPEILDKFKNVEFMIFGALPDYMKATDRILHHSQWFGINEYPQELAKLGFDIALAPLKDNEFNRCKSNLRWLEMSALKIPTVCSNVEPFKKSVISGSTGFLANTRNEWLEAIESLIVSKTRRLDIGLNAYKEVKKSFNVDIHAKRYYKLLEELNNDKKLNNLPIISENPLWEQEALKNLPKEKELISA